MTKNKKAVSPVVATVLLVSIVIVLGLIVFMWFRGITEEAIVKFEGENIKMTCDDVVLSATYLDGSLIISNNGNVPVYQIKVEIKGNGEHDTFIISDNWPTEGLLQGARYEGSMAEYTIDSGSVFTLIPVLIGSTSEGDKTYTCDDRNSIEVAVA